MKGQCNNAYNKEKKKYKTFEEALANAKRFNAYPKTIHKQVAYKCRQCLRFHTGRSVHGTLNTHKVDIFQNN